MASAGIPSDATGSRLQSSTPRQQFLYVVGCMVAGALMGMPAGFIWVRLSDPPSAALTSDGVYFGETELNQQVGVTLWFLAIGVALGLAAGLVVGWLGHRHGVTTVIAVLALCGAAALVTYLAGVHIFGPDEQAQLAGAAVGDQITSGMGVETKVALLGWPIGGLVGALAAMFGWPRQRSFVAVTPSPVA